MAAAEIGPARTVNASPGSQPAPLPVGHVPPAPAITARIDFADPLVLTGTPGTPGSGRLRHAFGKPVQVLRADRLADVRDVVRRADALSRQGFWCVGYLHYEAAAAFDAALPVHAAVDGAPLAWFGVYDAALPWAEPASVPQPTVEWASSLSRTQFDTDFAAIQADIADGRFYQVNYTAPWLGRLMEMNPATATANPNSDGASAATAAEALFAALRRAQPQGYLALIDSGCEQVLSVSPELFFHWQGDQILTRPVKGTAARGGTPESDAQQAVQLRASAKERAENVMIVDLLRNDVSRIATSHSVRVRRLFAVEALPSVWQMASDIEATTRPGTRLDDVLAALFPCGSVTGAPKVEAMRAIRALEPTARGVYCGAVGVLQPGGTATFNVPIRTVTLRGAQLRCGIGSGITSSAEADAEWQEWRHKRAFLERASAPFDVLETLGLRGSVFSHGAAHLARMQCAAQHFGYPWNTDRVEAALTAVAATHPQGDWRVRLLLNAQGLPHATAYPLEPHPLSVRLQLADRPFDAADSEFVRFKTTRRAHYDAFAPAAQDVFDTVLWNARGEVTETTRGNLAVLLAGRWTTPPSTSGLLAGVGRAHWVHSGRLVEAVVTLDDLAGAEQVAFINSLRGWIAAEVVAGVPASVRTCTPASR